MFDESPILRPANLAKTGLAKISGGALQLGIPGSGFTAISSSALAVNDVRYVFFRVTYAINVTAMYFEVTAAPAGAANVRLGIYALDTDCQPTGAPIINTSVAVAGAFTGVKSATGLTGVLAPGFYAIAVNTDVIMTLRTFISGCPFVSVGLGATPYLQRVSAAQTFGSLPTPGTPWTTITGSAGGNQNCVLLQWTE